MLLKLLPVLPAAAIVVASGCATPTTVNPSSPSPAATTPAAPEVSPPAVTAPPVSPVSKPRDPERCAALTATGMEVQRAQGEGGASEAAALYRQALEADAMCTQALWELGWSLQQLDAWDEAVAAWERLRTLDSDYPELSEHYPIAVMRRDQARALAALPEAEFLPVPVKAAEQGPKLRIRAVGDVQMGMAWPTDRATLPPDDGAEIFTGVQSLLQDADITFGNLETVLMDEGDSTKCGPRSTRCYAFRVPTRYAKTLKDAGFTVMSIANNHTGDFGEAGRQATIDALDDAGIAHSGPVGDIAALEAKGLRIGLVAFSTGGGVYRVQDIKTAQRVVAAVDRGHDLVVVSFHGGAEGTKAARVPQGTEYFLGENRGDLRAFARAVIDAGADLVLGHGPHLLRGMEHYRGRLIAYSLGNFSSWNTFNLKGALGVSAVLEATLAPNGVLLEAALHPVHLKKPGRPMPDPQARAFRIVRKLSRLDFGDPLFDTRGRFSPTPPPDA